MSRRATRHRTQGTGSAALRECRERASWESDSFVGLLDNYSDIEYADSMRVLFSDMVGQPLFRLYGLTSTAQSDFKIDSPNSLGWGTHTSSSGQTIAAWMSANGDSVARFVRIYDQSTSGTNFREQTTAGSMANYKADAFDSGSKPGVDFLDHNALDTLDTAIAQTSGVALYGVCYHSDTGSTGYDQYLRRSGASASYYMLNRRVHVYNGAAATLSTVDAEAICRWKNTASESGARINLGTEDIGGAQNATLNWTGFSDSAGSQYSQVYMGENILFSVVPAADTDLVTAMAEAWGITL